jgi:hypothetical protein
MRGGHLSAGATSLRRHRLGAVLVMFGTVDILLEDGFRLVDLPLCLELSDVIVYGAAVGPAAGLVEVEVFVVYLSADAAPVALAATVLLRLGGILVGETGLAEELGDELLARQAVGNGLVVAAVELLRPGHLDGLWLLESGKIRQARSKERPSVRC